MRASRLITPLLAIALLVLSANASAWAWRGKVVNVSDGDTVTVLTDDKQQVKVRLYGIDAPEKSQAYGSKATDALRFLVALKTVEVEEVAKDRYGRTVAILHEGPMIVNQEMVRAGYAWVYRQYCKRNECVDWKWLEAQAKDKKLGLWADSQEPVAPWEWRRGGTKGQSEMPPEPATASGVAYHGNVQSHVFHKPGCKSYECQSCTATFSTRDDAIKAGYRPCGVCKP